MSILYEGRHAAEFLVSEANNYRSRDAVTIAYGSSLDAGTVLGQVSSSGKYKPFSASATDGSENPAAVLYFPTDASEGDVEATVIARDAEVKGEILGFPSGITNTQRNSALSALADAGIVAR